MNTYRCSDGSRLKKSVVDSLVKKAKKEKLRQQYEEHGYNFCEVCGISNGTYLDCSHDISVRECQNLGETEKSFDVDYITIRCRQCHNEKDKTNLQWRSQLR